jgi:hypothetical protein
MKLFIIITAFAFALLASSCAFICFHPPEDYDMCVFHWYSKPAPQESEVKTASLDQLGETETACR